MEMASAHGLALKLVEMNRLDRINRNEHCEIISEEDKIIKSWFLGTNQSRFYFFCLTRKTLLFVLSHLSLKDVKKKELIRGISMYFKTFSEMLKSNIDILRPLIEVIVDPWKNTYFSWEELFQKRVDYRRDKVQQFFRAEPEEIVMARVHLFSRQGKDDASLILAKNSFLFHSRIAKDLTVTDLKISSNPDVCSSMNRKGAASMDWYLHNLQKKKNVAYLWNELKQLTCHEGVLLVMRLRQIKWISLAFSTVQVFIMQELVQPSKFCCTKKLFSLWCILHKEQKTSVEVIGEEIRKMMALYAPSSAHFYLLVDCLWEQFGTSLINIYVELYIRGLTVDLNHLEAARSGDMHDDVVYLESHIASTFYKLSTLFIDFHEGAARECMFSAFSLKPTRDRLCILQSLTLSILSSENEVKSAIPASLQECKCAVKCAGGLCIKEHTLDHPILMKGIPNVPYLLVKDLVSVLESVRCFGFQYNLFDWHNNATDLGDYLRDFSMSKSWESDTECASEGGSVRGDEDNANDPLFPLKKCDSDYLHHVAKRKNDPGEMKDAFPLDVGANIEVGNEAFLNKRIKMDDQNDLVGTQNAFNVHRKTPQDFSSTRGMEDAIEDVIRKSLKRPNVCLNNSPVFTSPVSDGSLSSVYTTASEKHDYQYSLANYGRKKIPNSSFPGAECAPPYKSDVENSVKYAYSPPSSAALSHALSLPCVSRESVISPSLALQRNLTTMQEHACKQMTQNKLLAKTVSTPFYSRTKEIPSSTVNAEKNVPLYQQEAFNLGCKSSLYEQIKNVSHSSHFVTNQTTMQVLRTSSVSEISNTPDSPSNSPINLVRHKQSTPAQMPQYTPVSHPASNSSSIFKSEYRYQVVDNSTLNKTVVKRSVSCFQENQLIHRDRSSVIQHTMQHGGENDKVEMSGPVLASSIPDVTERMRNVPKKEVGNLPPLIANAADRSIANSSVAVSSSLVTSRMPQPMEICPQPVCSSTPIKSADTITIPGVPVSQSVIVSPWIAERKVHGEMMYKKKAHPVAAAAFDKRNFKNPIQKYRQVSVKTDTKMIGQRIANQNVTQVAASPSHVASNYRVNIPTVNQSSANASQNWVAANKSSSSPVAQSAPSQPWYSVPFRKLYHDRNNASPSSSGNNIVANTSSESDKDVCTKMKVVPLRQDSKHYALYTQHIRPSKNQPSLTSAVSSTSSHFLHNPVSTSVTKSNTHNVGTYLLSNTTSSAVASNNTLHRDYSSPSLNSAGSIKTYSLACKAVTNTSESSDRLQYKTNVAYTVPDGPDHYSRASSKEFPSSCCSPSELNPCQNCSLPSENDGVQSLSKKNLEEPPLELLPSGEKLIPENDLIAPFPNDKDGVEREPSPVSYCQYCSQPVLVIELSAHILSCPARNFDEKNDLVNEMDPGLLMSENLGFKSLPDVVPEQESFRDDLPHSTKPLLDVDDDKNLDEIDANTFSACMDLIYRDKDLKRIVQGIDPLDQMENNYLPYVPQTDSFSTTAVCSEMDKSGALHNLDAYQRNKLGEGKSFNSSFQFNELPKSVQQAKPYTERISTMPPAPKSSNELSFSTLAEMIKVTISDECPNDIESEMEAPLHEVDAPLHEVGTSLREMETPLREVETPFTELAVPLRDNQIDANYVGDLQKMESPKFPCPYCPKSLCSLVSVKRHIFKLHPGLPTINPQIDVSSIPDGRDCNFKSRYIRSGSRNSYDSSNSLNVLSPEARHNYPSLNASEMGNILPKGRIRGIIKSPTTKCKFCGKILTTLYLKKHILKKHGEIKSENSSDLNIDMNQSPASPVDMHVTPLLEQDIDSSTCLSASDALKQSGSFAHTEASEGQAENEDVKFNFNILKFSENNAGANTLAREENQLENVPLKNTEENSFMNKVYSKQVKYFEQKQTCPICGKFYNTVGYLNRHLKIVHNVLTAKAPKRNKVVSKIAVVENIKCEENRDSTTHFEHVGAEKLNASTEEPPVPFSRSPEKLANCTVNPNLKAKERLMLPNNSLLKAVLQSNFVKDHKESWDKQVKVCDTSKTYDSGQSSVVEDVHSHNVDKISASVPFEKSLETEKSGERTDVSQLGADVHFNSSVSQNSQSVSEMNVNSDVKCPTLANSQTSSVHSNEITPVSQMISNVSKCHFGSTSINNGGKETFEDNSLKLLIPENTSLINSHTEANDQTNGHDNACDEDGINGECRGVNSNKDARRLHDREGNRKQEFMQEQEKNSVHSSNEDDLLFEKEMLANEQCDFENLDKNIMCRLCHQNLDSMEILSMHLKEVHDIPVLKKHISPPSTPEKSAFIQEIGKLSPPKLKLGTNESDSESVSDFENVHGSKNEDDPSVMQDEKNASPNSTASGPGSSSLVGKIPDRRLSASNPPMFVTLSTSRRGKFRRHSLGTSSKDKQIDNSQFEGKRLRKKSVSLLNIKIISPPATTIPEEPEKCAEACSEDTSFSSITNHCRSSYDSTSSSTSSQNSSVPWSINSSFLLPNSHVPRLSRERTILRSKLSGRKLIIQRLKAYTKQKKIKKKSKSRYFSCHRKLKSKKTYKPIILTLKKATDVQEFLETHKQPIVKLIRLKENEFNCVLDKETNPIPSVTMKEAIVKLERIHIPSNINKVVLINQDLLVPELVSQDAHIKTESADIDYTNSSTNSIAQGPPDAIEMFDSESCSSSDSVQFLGAITKEEKRKSKTKFCSTPSTKKCFVVLNRISV